MLPSPDGTGARGRDAPVKELKVASSMLEHSALLFRSGRIRCHISVSATAGPRVRIHLPPAESQQTFGSSQYRRLLIEAAWCYRFP